MTQVLRPFEYLAPATVVEAVKLLSLHGMRSKVIAGGVDLVDRMRRCEIKPEYVVDLSCIEGLDYIEGDSVECAKIGALTTLLSIERSQMIQKEYVPLWEAVHQIASVQVTTMGTLVGNLCVASSASDISVALYALGAELKISSPDSERVIPIESFFSGVQKTVLKPDEIVIEVILPPLSPVVGSAFLNLVRSAADIAKVNVAVMIVVTNDICKEVKIALGSVAPTVVRAKKAETKIKGKKLEQKIIEATAEIAAEEVTPITDIRSTAEYRKEMVKELVIRAIEKALGRLHP